MKNRGKYSYSPASFHFNSLKWRELYEVEAKGNKDSQRIFQSGLILGNIVARGDAAYSSLLDKYKVIKEGFLISFAIKESLLRLSDFETYKSEGADAYFEHFFTAIELLIAQTEDNDINSKLSENEHDCFLRELVNNISIRVFFVDKWNKVRDSDWTVLESEFGIYIYPQQIEKEFGKAISIYRFQQHLRQLHYSLLSNNKTGIHLLIPFKKVPKSIHLSKDARLFEYQSPGIQQAVRSHNLLYQVPFYFKGFIGQSLKNYSQLSVLDVIYSWGLFIEISNSIKSKIIECKQNLLDIYKIAAFTENELLDTIEECLGFKKCKSRQILQLFSKSKSTIRDIWLTPIYQCENKFWIVPTLFLTGQFQRVIDSIIFDEIEQSGNKKGRYFEDVVSEYLSEQIIENKVLDKKNRVRSCCLPFQDCRARVGEWPDHSESNLLVRFIMLPREETHRKTSIVMIPIGYSFILCLLKSATVLTGLSMPIV